MSLRTVSNLSDPRRQRLALWIGMAFFFLFAVADSFFTLRGMRGDTSLEGNPFLQWTMDAVGPEWGLISIKTATLAIVCLIAVVGVRAINEKRPWIYWIALTPWSKGWMKRRKRFWLAYLPLYLTAFSQAFGAGAWLYLEWRYGIL